LSPQNLRAQLESRLGIKLLNRTTRDMSLTEEGRRLLDVLLTTDPAQRVPIFEEGLRAFPDSAELIAGLAWAVGEQGDVDAAVAIVRGALDRGYVDDEHLATAIAETLNGAEKPLRATLAELDRSEAF